MTYDSYNKNIKVVGCMTRTTTLLKIAVVSGGTNDEDMDRRWRRVSSFVEAVTWLRCPCQSKRSLHDNGIETGLVYF